jgi:hypothetical protein
MLLSFSSRFTVPITPWQSCQRSPANQRRLRSPSNPRVAPRLEAADPRLRILELLTTALSVAHIARVEAAKSTRPPACSCRSRG